jgi:hypothetical protein
MSLRSFSPPGRPDRLWCPQLLYDWRFTANRFVLATIPVRLTTSNFIFQLNTCSYNLYVTSSFRWGCVCRLQLLLVLASSVILRSESRGTHEHILLSQIRDPPTWRARSPFLYSPEQVSPVVPSGTGFPFRRLLRLESPRWRYSIPPPHGMGVMFSSSCPMEPGINRPKNKPDHRVPSANEGKDG